MTFYNLLQRKHDGLWLVYIIYIYIYYYEFECVEHFLRTTARDYRNDSNTKKKQTTVDSFYTSVVGTVEVNLDKCGAQVLVLKVKTI